MPSRLKHIHVAATVPETARRASSAPAPRADSPTAGLGAETWVARDGRAALTLAGRRVTNLPWDSRLELGWALRVPVMSVITMMLLLAPSPIGVTGFAGAKEAVTL